jgi:hypothetical protein
MPTKSSTVQNALSLVFRSPRPSCWRNDVDGVGRRDLGAQLVPQAGLARSVGQQRGVEQGDERFGQRVGPTVGAPAVDGVEHGGGHHRRRRWIGRHHLAQPFEQRPGHVDAHLHPVVVADVGQRPLDLAAQVPADAVGGLGGAQRALLDGEPVGQLVELQPQPLGDERLVQPRIQLVHGGDATSSPAAL